MGQSQSKKRKQERVKLEKGIGSEINDAKIAKDKTDRKKRKTKKKGFSLKGRGKTTDSSEPDVPNPQPVTLRLQQPHEPLGNRLSIFDENPITTNADDDVVSLSSQSSEEGDRENFLRKSKGSSRRSRLRESAAKRKKKKALKVAAGLVKKDAKNGGIGGIVSNGHVEMNYNTNNSNSTVDTRQDEDMVHGANEKIESQHPNGETTETVKGSTEDTELNNSDEAVKLETTVVGDSEKIDESNSTELMDICNESEDHGNHENGSDKTVVGNNPKKKKVPTATLR